MKKDSLVGKLLLLKHGGRHHPKSRAGINKDVVNLNRNRTITTLSAQPSARRVRGDDGMDLRLTRKARGKILGTSAVKASLVIVAIASLKLKACNPVRAGLGLVETEVNAPIVIPGCQPLKKVKKVIGLVQFLGFGILRCSAQMPLQSIAQRPMASIPRAFPEKVLLSGFKLWLRLRNDLPD
ncbi:unnamed protein product [Sphenostylis stenocarpa]|uniref:Uncharacterized protein n=1 Tax=Sphenostylis stenocarpa TaxID=92480 RepID=A0AA86VZW3_9FABA|nr:unnamed protein product [Sphenostylis stenocarpa]